MAQVPNRATSRAVLIGVRRYDRPDDFCHLPSVGANLRELREVLTDPACGGLLPASVTTVREPRTRGRILEEIDIAAAQARDLLLVYFSGHGYMDPKVPEVHPDLYLLPEEATHEAFELYGIRYSDLRDRLCRARARHVVLILDCCYSGNVRGLAPPDRPNFTVMTSSKPLALQYAGDSIHATPCTAALVKVLREGAADDKPVTVDALRRRLAKLATEDNAAARVSSRPDPNEWEPKVLTHDGGGGLVLSRAIQNPAEPPHQRVLRVVRATASCIGRIVSYLVFWWNWAFGRARPSHNRVVGTAVVAVLLTGLLGPPGWLVYESQLPRPPCPSPLELRILTAPEHHDALDRVIERFQWSAEATADLGEHTGDCRHINATVYAAPTGQVVPAFQASAAWAEPERACKPGEREDMECEAPLRDIGPHPDVWIPAASSTYYRGAEAAERPEAAMYFGEKHVLAHSPAVLAAPRELTSVQREGEPLEKLLQAAEEEGLTVRRASPHSSEAALAHRSALPGDAPFDRREPDPGDDQRLLCSLTNGDGERSRQSALLIAESSTTALNMPALRPSCLAGQHIDEYHPYYPSDVPWLDLTYVPVGWERGGTDADERRAAISRLGDWLTGPDGQAALEGEGFRAKDEGTEAPDPLGPGEVNALIDERESGRSERDVVFVLDLSSSSYTPAGRGTTLAAFDLALRELSDTDRYGIVVTPGPAGQAARWALEFGRHTRAEGMKVAHRLEPVDRDAPVRGALAEGLTELTDAGGGDRKQLLALIADGEDSTGTAPEAASGVPAVVIGLPEFGCAPALHKELAEDDGDCVGPGEDQTGAIAERLGGS